MGDQEGALGTMMQETISLTKGRGEWVGAVPEHSAVGQSASNSRAERSVQRVEDHIRTLLGELESRVSHQFEANHPVISWMVEYAAVLLNTFPINDATGMSAHQLMHGKPADAERSAYFGERVFFLTPARRRSNLDLRWGVGVYLGTRLQMRFL